MSSAIGSVLVYGATGAQGSAVVRALLAEHATVRVLLRPGTANPFGDKVDVVRGDMADRKKLELANFGVDKVVLTLPTIPDHARSAELGRNAVDAAKVAGVKLLVFNQGGPIPEARTGVGLMDVRVEVEAYLKASGVPGIMVRLPIYMDNITAWSVPAIMAAGMFAYPLPADFRASWISHGDMAAFVVEALRRPDLAGRAYRIGGPDALTGTEVAELLSADIGRPVSYVPLPLTEFAAGVNAAYGNTMGDEIAAFYRWLHEQPTSPLVADLRPALQALPVKLTTFADWARAQDWKALASRAVAA